MTALTIDCTEDGMVSALDCLLRSPLCVFCGQRTPPWVLPREELAPKWAVPAAQHGSGLTLWLQRQAVLWQNELLIGTTLVGNKSKMLCKVSAEELLGFGLMSLLAVWA